MARISKTGLASMVRGFNIDKIVNTNNSGATAVTYWEKILELYIRVVG